MGLREPSVIRPNQCLLFFDFGFAGRGAALTRRRLVAFACGSVASTFLFCSKSDQNFAVSFRNCSARNMTRSCKKRLPCWESLLIRAGCLYRIAHSDCLPPLPNAAAGSAACVFISQEGPSVPASGRWYFASTMPVVQKTDVAPNNHDGLAGWACRIRTSESVREPPNWICVTISPEVGASPAAETRRVRAAVYGFAAPANSAGDLSAAGRSSRTGAILHSTS